MVRGQAARLRAAAVVMAVIVVDKAVVAELPAGAVVVAAEARVVDSGVDPLAVAEARAIVTR